jgi:fibronectin-binding autotransporter adhesin
MKKIEPSSGAAPNDQGAPMKNLDSGASGGTTNHAQRPFRMALYALRYALILVAFISFGSGQARAQCGLLAAPSTTWNDGNGNWGVAGNWTSGTPTSSTNACILDGTSTVTVNTSGQAAAVQVASGNALNINAAASLTLASGDSVVDGALSNSGSLINSGGLASFSGSIENSGYFANYGGLNVSFGATIQNSAGALLTNFGVIGAANIGEVDNQGTLLNAPGAAIYAELFSTFYNGSGAYLANAGTLGIYSASLSNSGTIRNTGTIQLDYGPDADGLSNSGTIYNPGIITMQGCPSDLPFNQCAFSNSGTIHDSGTITNGAVFTNSGTVRISSSGVFTTTTPPGGFSSNYTQIAGSTLVNGTLNATGGAIVDIQGGTLGGRGTINGDVAVAGTITAGDPRTPGTLTINGSLDEEPGGTLDELISRTAHSVLDVTGDVTLEGALNIDVLSGTPSGTYDILDYTAGDLVAGDFTNVIDGILTADGYTWDVNYYADGGTEVTVTATPEPGALPMLLLGLIALAGFRRRKIIPAIER